LVFPLEEVFFLSQQEVILDWMAGSALCPQFPACSSHVPGKSDVAARFNSK